MSILGVLLLLCSLAACSGGEKENTTIKKTRLSTYVNEKALKNTDNVSFVFGEDEDELFIVNIHAPDLLEELTLTDKATLQNDMLWLRIFGKNWTGRDYGSWFTFQGYGEIKLSLLDAAEISPEDEQTEILNDEGGFLFVEQTIGGDADYEVWVKHEDQAVFVDVDGLDGYRLDGKEGHKAFYDTVKEHFSFAKVKKTAASKDGITYTTFDIKKATVFAEGKQASAVKDWVFANDLLYNQVKENGITLPTAYNLSGSNSAILLHCDLDDKETYPDGIIAQLCPVAILSDGYAQKDRENAFTVGKITFVPDGHRTEESNGGFVMEQDAGEEYHIYIYSQDLVKDLSYESVKSSIELMFS